MVHGLQSCTVGLNIEETNRHCKKCALLNAEGQSGPKCQSRFFCPSLTLAVTVHVLHSEFSSFQNKKQN